MRGSFFHRFLTHATIVFAALFLTLLVLDHYNPSMDFISSGVSKLFLLGFALCAFVSSILSAISQFRERHKDGGAGRKE